MPVDAGDAETVLSEFRREGIDDDALAARLQREGAEAFSKSWRTLLSRLSDKSSQLTGATSP